MIDVCSDASVAYQWFHSEGEDQVEVAASRALTGLSAEGTISLAVLDLTRYEVANASMLGRGRASAEQVVIVLDALAEICPNRQIDRGCPRRGRPAC